MGLFDRVKKKNVEEEEKQEEPGINVLTPEEIKSAKESQDVHLYTEVIHSSKIGLAILISYTEEYFYDMLEFLSMCTRADIHTVSAQSTYEEDTGKVDAYGEPVVINHNRYYVIVSATLHRYCELYIYGGNLANTILNAVQSEIYSNCNPHAFGKLINDGILDGSLFSERVVGECKIVDDMMYMDTRDFMSRVPNAFTLSDILQVAMIDIITKDNLNMQLNYSITQFCCSNYSYPNYKEMYDDIFLGNRDKYFDKNILVPIYMIDDEVDTGDMSDEDVDDIFKEQYNKFSPVSDDLIQYEDIDEVVEDDE